MSVPCPICPIEGYPDTPNCKGCGGVGRVEGEAYALLLRVVAVDPWPVAPPGVKFPTPDRDKVRADINAFLGLPGPTSGRRSEEAGDAC